MWVVHSGNLFRLPDDAPLPPGAVTVELPQDFFTSPELYKVEGAGLVKRSDEETRDLEKRLQEATLTGDDIARIKRAIADGRL